MEEKTENIEEKIAQQMASVKKLEESYQKNPSGKARTELDRERDTLRHLTNTQTGSAKDRAAKTAAFARKAALRKAIEPVPPE
jgi:hypothetical protein